MKIVIESAADLCEVENLLMMVRFAKTHGNYGNDYAKRAAATIEKARRDYIEEFHRQNPLFAEVSV
jgi:hypothetical protein